MIDAIGHALWMALAMGWEILWPLVLGFALSGAVQAVVSHQEMSRLMPDDGPRSIAIALGLGAASSSCSYAAVALARSVFRKGANFTAAMAFQMASTNLVLELSIILVVLMGWHFMLAEAVGAPVMVALLVVLFRLFLRPKMVAEAKRQADRGIAGRMEGHAEMDMSVRGGSIWQRLTSPRGLPRSATTSSWTGRRCGWTSSVVCSSRGRSPPGCRMTSGRASFSLITLSCRSSGVR